MDLMSISDDNGCDGDDFIADKEHSGDASTSQEEEKAEKEIHDGDDDDDDDMGIDGGIGEWLDDKSREPISATSGSCRLCNACKHLFTKCQPFGRFKPDPADPNWYLKSGIVSSPFCRFLRNMDTLKYSAIRDCAFCKLMNAGIERKTCEPVETFKCKIDVQFRGTIGFPYLMCAYDCYDPTNRSQKFREYSSFDLIQNTSQSSPNVDLLR